MAERVTKKGGRRAEKLTRRQETEGGVLWHEK